MTVSALKQLGKMLLYAVIFYIHVFFLGNFLRSDALPNTMLFNTNLTSNLGLGYGIFFTITLTVIKYFSFGCSYVKRWLSKTIPKLLTLLFNIFV